MDFRPLNLSDDEYQEIAELVHRKAGIYLHAGKKELVRARLAKIIRQNGYQDFQEYYQRVIDDQTGDEVVRLLDALSTNLTSFFREPRHFDFMEKRFLPELEARRKKEGGRRLRVWSAGCSTGEEPYSIAITVLEHSPFFEQGDFKVLATDLAGSVLSVGARGVYPEKSVHDLPKELLRAYFRRGHGQWAGWYQVRPEVRERVVYRRFNLVDSFPFRKPMDLIFCRNVMIYFDKPTQRRLVEKFYLALDKGGYLFIGHSESLSGLSEAFKYVEPTVYFKKSA